jgi:hypothetical protein
MRPFRRGVARDSVGNSRTSLNSGYIIIPENFKGAVKRKQFVQNCYRKERVSIIIENGGGVMHNCYVTKQVLNDIVFPDVAVNERLEEKDEISRLGSLVVFISEPYLGQPVIIGILSKLDESQLGDEQEFRVIKSKDDNWAILSINGGTGEINITTLGKKSKSGNLTINVSNESDDAKINLTVRGSVNIATTGTTNITAGGDINLVTSENVTVKPVKKLLVGEAKEPMLLGTTTFTALEKEKKALKDSIDAINTVTPLPVPSGAVDPTWALVKAKLALITDRGDYSKIKSEKSFID